MLKREREVGDMIERAGLELLNMAKNGQHYQVTLRAANGATRRFAVAKTPGDIRGDLNQEGDFKRWARENAAPETAISVAMKTAARDPGIPKVTTNKPSANMATAAPAKVESPLSHATFYRLCEWLKSQNLEKYPATAASLAAKAAKEMKAEISERHVLEGLEVLGVKLIHPTITMKDALLCLANEIHKTEIELGIEPSYQFTDFVTGRLQIRD